MVKTTPGLIETDRSRNEKSCGGRTKGKKEME
jgi:hypothetical protein